MFFGLPNGNNDINVLDRSPLVANLLQGLVVDMEFIVNGKTYPNYYRLVNGNYPQWRMLVQTIHEPQGEK